MHRYLLVFSDNNEDSIWYGYFDDESSTSGKWSEWQPSLTLATTTNLVPFDDGNTYTVYLTYIQTERPNWRYIELPGPISLNTHPEYFI